MTKPKILAVVGPTASGKTTLSLQIAQEFNGEIISTDSMQIYRYMNIGTSKATFAEQEMVAHHQINIVDPDEHYSAGKFERDTDHIISNLISKGKIPILVGGSGLYYRATLYGLSHIPQIPIGIKKEIQQSFEKNGIEYCYQQLQKLDPQSAQVLHSTDKARILRALEVYKHTHQSIKEFQHQDSFAQPKYSIFAIGYRWERKELYERINQRTGIMINQGWVDEVKNLLKKYPTDLRSLQSIGYTQIISFLQGNLSQEEMIEKIQQKTRNYAKRQLTWFQKESNIHWYQHNQKSKIFRDIQWFLEK